MKGATNCKSPIPGMARSSSWYWWRTMSCRWSTRTVMWVGWTFACWWHDHAEVYTSRLRITITVTETTLNTTRLHLYTLYAWVIKAFWATAQVTIQVTVQLVHKQGTTLCRRHDLIVPRLCHRYLLLMLIGLGCAVGCAVVPSYFSAADVNGWALVKCVIAVCGSVIRLR